MNIEAIIFDLDQTLIDSDAAKKYRDSKNWTKIYQMTHLLIPFAGIKEVLEIAHKRGIATAVVTSSSRTYCERLLTYWGLEVDYTVCYRDTRNHKPHPAPILKAISLIGDIDKDKIISIGDDPNDIIASRSAGVISGATLWGINNPEVLIKQNPDYIFSSVNELKLLINK